MSLFSTISLGQGYCQGASAIELFGMDVVMRKGGTGKTHDHAPISKSASVRALQDGFNIKNISDVSLIQRRREAPSRESTCHNAAGAVSPERRHLDMPAVLRKTSLEHIPHRRHSAPPVRQGQACENMIVQLACATDGADQLGRNNAWLARTRSPNRCSIASPRRRALIPKRARSQSPPKNQVSPFHFAQSNVVDDSKFSGRLRNTWGLFEEIVDTSLSEMIQRATIGCSADPLLNIKKPNKASSSSGWCSDDEKSTATGGSWPCRIFYQGQSSRPLFLDCLTPSASVSGLMDSSFVHVIRGADSYERRLKALVKVEQTKAMRKVGKS
mmetsp:Transcript_15931/g.25380  ORF Transcript_15931/g.25380 Transcript_15931/m.25380 type:complete len:328 (+) Transcript_15931:43-1026(+)